MRKKGYTGRYIKLLSYAMAALTALVQPCGVLIAEASGMLELSAAGELSASEGTVWPEGQTAPEGTLGPEEQLSPEGAFQPEEQPSPEETSQSKDNKGDSLKYIVAFEALAEEDAYFPCMYKPMLEELLGAFPETLFVWLDGEEEPVELAVAWECEEDFETVMQSYYFFEPKWDEEQYAIAETVLQSIEIPVITVEVPQSGSILPNPEEAKNSLYRIIQKKAVLASVYLCDTYEVKAGPSLEAETIHTVVSGQSVQITDVETDEYGGIWYRVLLYQSGVEYTGYVEREYLATSDEAFAEWEETWLDLSAAPMVMALSEGDFDIDQFPASYQNALYALKEKHPDWTFVRMDTGLDWNTVIANELGDKSWIPSSRSGSWQNGSASQRGWSYASEGILKYYMDPRNFLDDSHIFQFEQLVYNSSYHTTDAVQGILAGSFMASVIPDDGRTYAQAFTTIGQELGVSPFHLASRVLQEQGVRGSSALISGTYPGYEGYYNFFNISASGIGDAETVRRGLSKAKLEGWNTRYASLYGGAKIIGGQYILWGQDTLYLEKFNVANGKYANYTHQYMQNIEAPYYEASNIYKAYQKAGVLERRFVFKIPVYENMPASACAQPEKTDVITLDKTNVSSLEVDKSITLVPYVNGSKVDHVNDMTFTSSNPSVAVVDAQGKVTAIMPGDTTIICAGSGAASANCTVTVVKASPVVPTPVLSPVTYRDGIKLSDVVLPSGWAWVNGDTVLSVGTPSYSAVYTPEDITRYNTITKNISFTVTKTVPVCKVPTGLEVKSGETLGSVVLPEGFGWESDTGTVLTDVGEYTFYVSYNPDENNYYTVNHIPIIIQVKEAVPGQPSDGSGGSGSAGGTSGSGGSGSVDGTTGNGTGKEPDNETDTGVGNDGVPDGGTGMDTGSSNSGTAGSDGTVTGTGSSNNGSASGGNSSGTVTSTGSSNSGTAGSGGTVTGTGSSNSGTAGSGGTATSTGSSNSGTAGSGGTVTSTGSSNNGSAGGGNSSGTVTSTGSSSSGIAGSGGTATSTGSSSGGTAGSDGTVTSTGSSSGGTAGSDGTVTSTGSSNSGTNANSGNGSASSGNAQTSGTSESVVIENTTAEDTSATAPDEPDYFRPSVTIQMEDTTILTTEKMQMAKEQNFDLLLDMGGAVTWSIDVDSIDESMMSEVDMGLELGTNHVPQELIATILEGNKYLEITLAHQGAFGFEAVLNIALGKEYSGKYANLFYYNPETGALEFICDAIIGSDGVASLRFEHASSYLIIVSDYSMSGVSFEDDTVNPVTHWIMIGVFICMLLAVAVCGILFFLKKRRDEDIDDEDEEEDEEDDEDINEDVNYEEEYDDEADAVKKVERRFQTFDLMPVKEENERKENLRKPSKEADTEAENDEYFDEDEDDWIEDEDWQEPEQDVKTSTKAFRDSSTEDDWLDDDEWNAEDDWIEDDEWRDKE